MDHARGGLQKIVLEALNGAPAEEHAMLAWPVVCGASVAAKTRALNFEHGVLRVEVPDKAWRTQLLELRPHYAGALRRIAKVERIDFVLPEKRRT